MVQQYTPGAPDLLSLGSANTPLSAQRPVNEFHYYPTPNPDVYTWELTERDLSHGLNRVWGDLQSGDAGPDSHRLASSTLNSTYPGQAVLPHLSVDQAATVNATGYFSWVDMDGVAVVGMDTALYYGVHASGTLADTGYGPGVGNVISHVGHIVIGGANNARRIIIGRDGAAAQIVETTGWTVDATMHANTADLWDCTTSGLNASTPGVPVHGLYAGNGLYTLAASAATGDAPSPVQTVHGGGYGVGPLLMQGWPARAFYVMPRASLGVSMFNTSTPARADLHHCSLEFNDLQPMSNVPLSQVLFAKAWNDKLLASDAIKSKMYDGTGWSDMGWVTDREPNSDVEYRLTGYAVAGSDVYALSLRRDNMTGSNSRFALEKYDPEVKQWHQVSAAFTAGTASTTTEDAAGLYGDKYAAWPTGRGLVVNTAGSFVVSLPMGTHSVAQFVTPAGYSDFNLNRQTSGAGGSTGQQYEANGTARSAAMAFPPVPGGGYAVHVVEQVEVQGDVPAGGTTAKLQLQLATQTATGFSFSNNLKAQVLSADRVMREPTRFIDNEAFFTRLQYQLYLERDSTNTRQTPNGLPFVLRGLTFARGAKPMSPRAFWRSVGQRNGKKVV